MSEETFKDRRRNADRRQLQVSRLIPNGGCRRKEDRRQLRNQFDSKPWWLRTNYVEDIVTPTLIRSKYPLTDSVLTRKKQAAKAEDKKQETPTPEKKRS